MNTFCCRCNQPGGVCGDTYLLSLLLAVRAEIPKLPTEVVFAPFVSAFELVSSTGQLIGARSFFGKYRELFFLKSYALTSLKKCTNRP